MSLFTANQTTNLFQNVAAKTFWQNLLSSLIRRLRNSRNVIMRSKSLFLVFILPVNTTNFLTNIGKTLATSSAFFNWACSQFQYGLHALPACFCAVSMYCQPVSVSCRSDPSAPQKMEFQDSLLSTYVGTLKANEIVVDELSEKHLQTRYCWPPVLSSNQVLLTTGFVFKPGTADRRCCLHYHRDIEHVPYEV